MKRVQNLMNIIMNVGPEIKEVVLTFLITFDQNVIANKYANVITAMFVIVMDFVYNLNRVQVSE